MKGIEKVKTSRYDLIITDLRLPGCDGLEIVQTCKQESPSTEVIVITAYGSVDTAVQAIKSGAYDYITKPFEGDEIEISGMISPQFSFFCDL